MPNWVGDAVMGLPVLKALRKAFPDAHIAALCRGAVGEILEGNPYINEIINFSGIGLRRFFPLDNKGQSLIWRILREKFDVGVLLTDTFSSAWLFWMGLVKKRVGLFRGHNRFFINCPVRTAEEKQHRVLTYQKILAPLGIEASGEAPEMLREIGGKKRGKIQIGISPGAAYGSAKCWVPERFAEVATRLALEIPDSEVFIFGDKKMLSLAEVICKNIPEELIESGHIKNLVGKTNLKELVRELGEMDLLLVNDSGPMHLGAALRVPLVALFGPTDDIVTGPYRFGEIIHKRVLCSPCHRRVCPIDSRCMTRIETEEVMQALKRQLLIPIREKIAPPVRFDTLSPVNITPFKEELPKKKIGTIILAAGMGRRLGALGAKGCIKVGDKSLYEILIEKGSERVAIMTSPATHKETVSFLREKGIIHVDLFQSRCFPNEEKEYGESPEGNGAVFEAFYKSGLLDRWSDVDLISVIPIDNPLADPLDANMSALCEELVVRAIEKRSPEENLGSLADKEGKLVVAEYFELPDGEKEKWLFGYTGMFMATREFFYKAAKEELLWHEVKRERALHYEKFAFDAFAIADKYAIVLGERESCFAPIKTREDLQKLKLQES
jgi:heptosyltransferase-2